MTAERTRRRAAAKATHPDLGGSHEAFVAAMAALEDEAPRRPAPVVFVRHPVRRRFGRLLKRRPTRTTPLH